MKWDSPWGVGFPGWHIECSAMSMKYLGDRFDIHTGGNDLRFPHHEDEIAQSEGAVGHQVVSIWVHGGHLRQSGQKISKSTGNTIRVPDLVERGVDPLAFRWLTFQTRYRSEMDFTWEAMDAADAQGEAAPPPHGRVGAGRRATSATRPGPTTPGSGTAVATDLDMPAAVVVVNEVVGATDVSDGEKYALLASWDAVLGLDLEREATSGWAPTDEMLRHGGRPRRGPRGARTTPRATGSATSSPRWASRSWTPPRARRSARGTEVRPATPRPAAPASSGSGAPRRRR